MNHVFVERLYILHGEPPRLSGLAYELFARCRDEWRDWFVAAGIPDEAYLDVFEKIMASRAWAGRTNLNPPKSQNAAAIESDLELYGVAYTVNGVRVDPWTVVRYDRPKNPTPSPTANSPASCPGSDSVGS